MKNCYSLLWAVLTICLNPVATPLSAQLNGGSVESRIVAEYFDDIFGADERLITGSMYKGAMKGSIQGHPYYSDEEWKPGSVEVSGKLFTGLLLNYDIHTNEIVMTHVTTNYSSFQLSLRSHNISKITIGNRTFIPTHAAGDSSAVKYAELLADGKIQYVIIRSKNLMLTNGSGNTDYVYREERQQYIKKGDQLVPFRSRNTLLKLYPEYQTGLKQYARNNRLHLGPKQYIHRALWVTYCNDLLRTRQ
jgi:hypothetical protein